jgi:uncharacterized flavoprotein (TIGR03862 family)
MAAPEARERAMSFRALVIGGGPSGLMAAETLANSGVAVELCEAMPSCGRKFLLAGKGGLNLTHAEAFPQFISRYRERATNLEAPIAAFDNEALRAWARWLGVQTFVGTSQRVFPSDLKAAPLLRGWLKRLRGCGVHIHTRHRWLGWDANGAARFATPDGGTTIAADVTILALGGASWPELGSDGAWQSTLREVGAEVAPLVPANCGFEIAWSAPLRERHAGAPVKPVRARLPGSEWKQGEFVISAHGVEGSLIYALSAKLREAIARDGHATLELDLLPGVDEATLATKLARPRGSHSFSKHLHRAGLDGVKAGLLREATTKDELADPAVMAAHAKCLPLRLTATRPIAEAISSAGGVRFETLDERLMLRTKPGVFCAGEMLDWEAPTGGYLLTACFATGRAAGLGAIDWLQSSAERAGNHIASP